MDTRSLLIYEVIAGFAITAIVTLFYGIVAPWYKQSAGRYIFGLLLALTLILSHTILRIWIPSLDPYRFGSILLFGFYIVAIASIGFGVYRAQIGHYKKNRFIRQEKERHRQL